MTEGAYSVAKGWVIGVRRHKHVAFVDLDLYDRKEQFVVREDVMSRLGDLVDKLRPESYVEIAYVRDGKDNVVKDIKVINEAKDVYPYKVIRHADPYDHNIAKLNIRHVMFKNPLFRDILEIRAHFIRAIQLYLDSNGFIEISTPVISPVTYYGRDSAFKLDFNGFEAYLNQCNAYYLEDALLGFQKVYSLIPSFRAERIDSPRYLNEYWHLKGEMANYDLYGVMDFIEKFVSDLVAELANKFQEKILNLNKDFNPDSFKPPFYRIDYDEAVEVIRRTNPNFQWGMQIGSVEEKILSQHFEKPFWVMHLPRKTQPFPYRLKPDNKEKTLTADLIFPWHGEVLGVAEKIYKMDELLERVRTDGLPDNNEENYRWYIELRDMGLPPHSGFGVGVERFLKAVLNAPHVRDVTPFPRLYEHRPVP